MATVSLILETLREHQLKATFFVMGGQVEENPGLLRSIVAEGHTIGNHSYYHADMSYLSAQQMTARTIDDAHLRGVGENAEVPERVDCVEGLVLERPQPETIPVSDSDQ